MLALARATGAPRMTREDAARTLGADLAQLEAALAGHAPDVPAGFHPSPASHVRMLS